MRYNFNSGYGQMIAHALPSGFTGKLFIVASTTVVNRQILEDLFRSDPDGVARIYTTLAAAIAACTASAGDVIVIAPGHAETITAAISVNVAGVSIIGLGNGSLTPTITVNVAGDGISMDAANTRLENIRFAAPETDEATSMVNVTAANVTVRNVRGIGSKTSKNFVDCITLASGADDCTLEDIELYNTTVAVNSFLSIEAAVARLKIKNFFAFGDVATAGIIDGAAATLMNWDGVVVGVVGSSKPAATLDSNPTGLIRRSRFSGTSTTIANNAALGNAIRLFDVLVLEETDGSKQGVAIPAVDAD